jgi:hypothetical protein
MNGPLDDLEQSLLGVKDFLGGLIQRGGSVNRSFLKSLVVNVDAVLEFIEEQKQIAEQEAYGEITEKKASIEAIFEEIENGLNKIIQQLSGQKGDH